MDPWLDRDFSATATAGDDDKGEDGIDNVAPALNGISTVVFYIGERSEPVDVTTETGFEADEDNGFDEASDLTIDFGFTPPMAVGNLVFVDLNRNGRADEGEGRAGVTVQLFRAGDDPALISPAAETVTGGGGHFLFSDLAAGEYFLRVPPSQFALTGRLAAHRVMAAVVPGDDNVGQDGIMVAEPSSSGVNTAVFGIIAGASPEDSTIDLTRDFGFITPLMSVGNRVFIDRDANGRFTPGEGVDGVRVELTQSITHTKWVKWTSGGGLYSFIGVEGGTYRLSIPASQFITGAPLWQMMSMLGSSETDDDMGEDGLDAESPQTTGVMTAFFVLNAPRLIEPELYSVTDDTRDFGFFRGGSIPFTFSEWQSGAPAGQQGPNDNADGDELENLLDYALPASSGLSHLHELPRWEKNTTSGGYDFVYSRRRNRAPDLGYVLELKDSLDADAPWKVSSAAVTVTVTGDDVEAVRSRGLDSDPLVKLKPFAFARLRVVLDANRDGQAEAMATSPIHVVHKRQFRGETISFGMPLAGDAIFSGLAETLEGRSVRLPAYAMLTFPAGSSGYLEVLDGVLAGHRIEVAESLCSPGVLVLEESHPLSTTVPTSSINGSRVIVRRHFLVKDLFSVNQHIGGTSVSTSANISFHNRTTEGWRTLWLFARNGERKWIDGSDAMFEDKGAEALTPGQPVFLRTRAGPVQFETTGWVRNAPVRIQLQAGNNFVANPWPADASPAALGFTAGNGFNAARRSRDATRLMIWKTDAQPVATGYENYYLFGGGTDASWVSLADASLTSMDHVPLIKGGTGFFLQLPVAHPGWLVPPPDLR